MMNTAKAKQLEKKLGGKTIDGWLVQNFVRHGKSAAVFKASQNGKIAALKIFDSDLIEESGKETQLERIKRECKLIGKTHPHLVEIFAGGYDEATDNFYLIMAFHEWEAMDECLLRIPHKNIASLLAQLASATKFLEDQELAHRDIKPANILISPDYTQLILLDLGVLKPFKGTCLTDGSGSKFIGTLQYSSPEFLKREEVDNLEGWRALTFYQMGAVLHDLIMKKDIFSEFQPWGKMVHAVYNIHPHIEMKNVPPELINLAHICLLKDAAKRLSYLSWESFLNIENKISETNPNIRLKEQKEVSKLIEEETPIDEPDDIASENKLKRAAEVLKQVIREICDENVHFPKCSIYKDQNVWRVSYELKNKTLDLFIQIDIVDLKSDTIALSVSEYLCEKNIANIPFLPDDKSPLYLGKLDKSFLSSQMKAYLPTIIEKGEKLLSTAKNSIYRIKGEE